MYLLGYDIGSSSVKAALVDAASGITLSVVQFPPTEMSIQAVQVGWAEQAPEDWWAHVCTATKMLLNKTGVAPEWIRSIGIAYQMHGLVAVNKAGEAVRPSIIWCDSRSVEIGNQAFQELGQERCLSRMLNSPGNFTASKLKWVKEHEPAVFEQIHKIMLPGDYIAMRLTGEMCTTPGGLSEGILWDFEKEEVADLVLDYFGFDRSLIPEVVPACALQGQVSRESARATGLAAGTPVAYRAGDQPNNALSLNVLEPGEVAATGGTSGVVYGIVDRPVYDLQSRVNSFAHVNHTKQAPRIGVLLCINGAGIQYSWVRQYFGKGDKSYSEMEQLAAEVPIGAEGLRILPFGNGAERMLENRNPGATIRNVHFNRHSASHFFRAALEGVAFSFVYGVGILQQMGVKPGVIRVGNDNLFQSRIFSETVAHLLQCQIEVLETTGAVGAAKAAGVAVGQYATLHEAMQQERLLEVYVPKAEKARYEEAYGRWEADLANL